MFFLNHINKSYSSGLLNAVKNQDTDDIKRSLENNFEDFTLALTENGELSNYIQLILHYIDQEILYK